MITDILTKEDFYSSGIDYAMMAYTNVLDMVLLLEELNFDENDEEVKEYWESARGKLKSSASLLHQGIDFLLKSRIAEVSPFLLIENNPEKFPKLNSGGKVAYSEFHTQDSSKLPKIHNTFCSTPLTARFTELYESSRTRRNKIMHTIDNRLSIAAKDILRESIELILNFTNENWVELRHEFLTHSPEYQLLQEDKVVKARLQSEFGALKIALTNEEFKKIYAIDKRRRFYLCPECSDEDYVYSPQPTAFLDPNSPISETMYCVICKTTLQIRRDSCVENNCPSNVITDWDTCGVCGAGQ